MTTFGDLDYFTFPYLPRDFSFTSNFSENHNQGSDDINKEIMNIIKEQKPTEISIGKLIEGFKIAEYDTTCWLTIKINNRQFWIYFMAGAMRVVPINSEGVILNTPKDLLELFTDNSRFYKTKSSANVR